MKIVGSSDLGGRSKAVVLFVLLLVSSYCSVQTWATVHPPGPAPSPEVPADPPTAIWLLPQ